MALALQQRLIIQIVQVVNCEAPSGAIQSATGEAMRPRCVAGSGTRASRLQGDISACPEYLSILPQQVNELVEPGWILTDFGLKAAVGGYRER